jgi:RhtB (resistance to homoserine/threonine) family protein
LAGPHNAGAVATTQNAGGLAAAKDARRVVYRQPGSAGPQAAPHGKTERHRPITEYQVLAPYWAEFLSLAIVHLLAVIAPGPDFAVAVRQTVRYGRKAGIYTSLGIGAGISVHVLYTLIGVGALLHTTPWLMTAAKWLGAAYIFYLGIKFLRSKPSTGGEATTDAPSDAAQQTPRQAFVIGFMTNATNPKATLFFLAVFTTLVSAKTPLPVQMLYGLWMCLVNAAWFVLVSVALSAASVRQRFMRASHWFERVMGVLLIGFALRLLFMA